MKLAPREEILTKWLAALRSGNYKQGVGYLRDDKDRYCCLGVLCEVAGLEPKQSGANGSYTFDGMSARLPHPLKVHMRMRGSLGEPNAPIGHAGYQYHSLAAMNDGSRLTFAVIADLIEKHQDLLFTPPESAPPSLLSSGDDANV